ncbi:MAG: hypothetical protein GX591_07740 [Planctomycetes bacterium]|nr:hypothetical protein [Planctomycetota bacterium]
MTTDTPSGRVRIAQRAVGITACALAAMFVLALARRPITSVDLGYHLAYGEVFWQTGRIVDDDTFIAPPITAEAFGPDAELPPGAWFDQDGQYRFPNANWLTQVILAGLYRAGGFGVLNATMLALVAAILAAQAAIVHRLKIPWAALAPIWLVLGAVGEERFDLRPELFAFACLTWQAAMLCGRTTWPRVAAFAAVQVLAVNLHSYWLLGAGVALAFAADAALRAAWERWMRKARPLPPELRRRLVLLGVLAAAMAPAAAIHPAGLSNAAYPLRTLAYLRAHDIAGRAGPAGGPAVHPWRTIGEFAAPFGPDMWEFPSTWILAALLIAAAPAAAALLACRRWAEAAVLAAAALAALSMRRNIILPAILAPPLIALAVALAAAWWRRRSWPARPLAAAGLATTALAGVLAGAAVFTVASGRLYRWQRRPMYFGGGVSRLALPLGPAAFLDAHLPDAGPIHTDYSLSSSMVFFADRVTAVPTLTNTWATPRERMDQVFQVSAGRLPPSTLDAWGLDVAVMQGRTNNQGLIRGLLADDRWALVRLEARFCVFVRRTEAHAALIAGHEITRESFDVGAFIAACRDARSTELAALFLGGGTLQAMGWDEAALAVWDALLNDAYAAGHFEEVWLNRGVCLTARGEGRLNAGDRAGLDDLRAADHAFQRALAIRPDYDSAKRNLALVRQEIRMAAAVLR